jgi:hypothetical protein
VPIKVLLWLGSVTDQGYGRFKAGGEIYMARRFAWQVIDLAENPFICRMAARVEAMTGSSSTTKMHGTRFEDTYVLFRLTIP